MTVALHMARPLSILVFGAVVCSSYGFTAGCGGSALIDGSGGWGNSSGSAAAPQCGPAPCGTPAHEIDVVAANQPGPVAIAIDKNSIYWANGSIQGPDEHTAGTVMRASKSGGDAVKLADESTQPVDVAVDDDFVYWGSTGGVIARAPKSGGEAEGMGTISGQILSVAVDADYVYGASPYPGTIMRIATKKPGKDSLAKDIGAFDIAADETDLYWVGIAGLEKCSKQDLVPVSFYEYGPTNKYGEIGGVAVDLERIYFTSWRSEGDCGEGHILSIRKDGSDLTLLASNLRAGSPELVVDETSVYWTEPLSGRVMKVSKNGGDPVTLACGQQLPTGIAVDEISVYWTNKEGNTIMKTSK